MSHFKNYRFKGEELSPTLFLSLYRADADTINDANIPTATKQLLLARTQQSKRITLFKNKGVTCVSCERVGEKVLIQQTKGDKQKKYHFGIWSEDDIQMTKDHIISKYNGGGDSLENLQVMCYNCNTTKRHYNSIEEALSNNVVNVNNSVVKFAKVIKKDRKFTKLKSQLDYYMKENRINPYKQTDGVPNYILTITDQLTKMSRDIIEFYYQNNRSGKIGSALIGLPKLTDYDPNASL